MGSLVLAKDGVILYSRSFGYRQVNENEKKLLTADTKYRISSITKMYTAVMIFQLVEEGKLKLTDTLDKFFPQIPNAARITMAQILSHRSGIPNFKADGSWGLQPRTPAEVVRASLKASRILSRIPRLSTAIRAITCWVTSSRKPVANPIRKH
jgi:CubicO group peptidase (beta-lactamase class C family)